MYSNISHCYLKEIKIMTDCYFFPIKLKSYILELFLSYLRDKDIILSSILLAAYKKI